MINKYWRGCVTIKFTIENLLFDTIEPMCDAYVCTYVEFGRKTKTKVGIKGFFCKLWTR